MRDIVTLKSSLVIPKAIVIIVVCTCLALAAWQWQRSIEKKMLMEQQHALNSQPLSVLMETPLEQMNGASVKLTGHFIEPYIWFLDNQVHDGRVGFDVLALLATNSLQPFNVLVNLGFVAAPHARTLPPVTLPKGAVSVNVILKSLDVKGFTLATQPNMDIAEPRLLQYIDFDYFESQTDMAIKHLVAHQQGQSSIVAIPHYQHVVMLPEKHRAYALQWLLIAFAAAAVAYFSMSKKELK